MAVIAADATLGFCLEREWSILKANKTKNSSLQSRVDCKEVLPLPERLESSSSQ
jgi:hypothetical protein